MADSNHSVVTVTLIIKSPQSEAVKIAQDVLLLKLNEWFTQDTNNGPPYLGGSLLFYSFSSKEEKRPPPAEMERLHKKLLND
jgi:hypothetical protein